MDCAKNFGYNFDLTFPSLPEKSPIHDYDSYDKEVMIDDQTQNLLPNFNNVLGQINFSVRPVKRCLETRRIFELNVDKEFDQIFKETGIKRAKID